MSRLNFSQGPSPAWLGGNSSMSTSRNLDLSNMNLSLNQSSAAVESSKHNVEVYGSMLPVLVVEAISTESVGFGSLSVKITEHGWAWLVCGRRLFVWKFKADDAKRLNTPCFELELPPSDLAHKADLVSLLSPASDGSGYRDKAIGVIAVSPEGSLRYWPNIAYESHSIETSVSDLYGEECMLLTNISPSMCVLGTTTSSLVCITIKSSESASPVAFRRLKTPQGMLAGFSKKVTSFIFGTMPTQTHESRPLVRILKATAQAEINSRQKLAYVLAGTVFQKWLLYESSEQLLYEYDMHRVLNNAFLEHIWTNTAFSSQLQLWAVDLAMVYPGKLTTLVACMNPEVSRQLYLAVATFEDSDVDVESNEYSLAAAVPVNVRLTSFNVLTNHTVEATGSPEEILSHCRLLSGSLEHSLLYAYDQSKVLCVRDSREVVDVIDFSRRDDGILGAGVYDKIPLLFTYRDALVSLVPKSTDIASAGNLSEHGHSDTGVPIPEADGDDNLDEPSHLGSDKENNAGSDIIATDSGSGPAICGQTGANLGDQSSGGLSALGGHRRLENDQFAPPLPMSEENVHEELRWLDHVERDEFKEASRSLFTLSSNETHHLAKKKTLLSLSKLAALAAGDLDGVVSIDEQLDEVLFQENSQEELAAR